MQTPLPISHHDGPLPVPESEAIVGTTEMAGRIRAHDWAASPLGPIASWSETLVATVNMTLAARFPIILFIGPQMVQLYNDAYLTVLGDRHPSALAQFARDCWPEIWPLVGHEYESVLSTGRSIRRDNALVPIRRKGVLTDEYYTYNHSPIFARDGSVLGILIIAHNTTDAVEAERQLRSSEARSNRILRSIGDAVIVTDAEFRITRMNPVAEALTAWPETEARGLPLHCVYHILDEATHQPVEDPAAKVRRLGTVVAFTTRMVLVRRDGSELPIDDSGAPIRDDDGQLSGIVVVFRDVSEKRLSDQDREHLTLELRDRYSEIEAVFRTAAIAMALIDPVEFRYLRVNDRLCAMLNATPEDLIGHKVSERVTSTPLLDAFHTVAAGTPVTGMLLEGELHTEPGVRRTWLSDYFPVCAPDGSVNAIAAASAEITVVKQAEAALLQSEKLAAVGRLATSIAHEINNPLESVTNLLYIARASIAEEEDEPGLGGPGKLDQLRQYLETADRELRRVAAITSQTLRFHKQSTNPRGVRPEEMIEDVLSIYQGRLINSHVTVEQRLRAHAPICCFEGEIRQVLANLVGNAIDAMKPAGGLLLVRTREGTDWSGSNGDSAERRGMILTIADSGGGMSSHTLARIFEPFFTTKGLSGTGLGLWVSQEIVGRHAGTLRVSSSQGKRHGTVFRLFLPSDAVSR